MVTNLVIRLVFLQCVEYIDYCVGGARAGASIFRLASTARGAPHLRTGRRGTMCKVSRTKLRYQHSASLPLTVTSPSRYRVPSGETNASRTGV